MKKAKGILLAIVICMTAIFNMEVQAEDIIEGDIEMSELMTEDALIGYSESQTRGVYLMEGLSIINDAGGGKIGVGGITNAAVRCRVSVTAIVERLSNGSWVRVTSYTATNTNALIATVSKSLLVSSGYYYRVRSSHYAGSDSSSSCTDALKM